MGKVKTGEKKSWKSKILGAISSILVIVVIAGGKGIIKGLVKTGAENGLNNLESRIEDAIYADAVVGVWEANIKDSEEKTAKFLSAISLSDEEKAFCKSIESECVKIQEYNEDGTYKEYFDVVKTKECVKDFYDKVHVALYENRESLNDFYSENYNVEIKDMSQDEFNEVVAELYNQNSYEEMLEYFAGNAYDYDDLAAIVSEGTYAMNNNEIHRTEKGETTPTYLDYSLKNEDNTLILGYLDGTETYTRVE